MCIGKPPWTARRNADRVLGFFLPADLRHISGARHQTRQVATAWGLPALADDAERLVGELAANALRHTSGPAYLHLLQRDGVLRVEVSDTEPFPVKPEQPDLGSESGWGLWLVEQSADRWGCQTFTWGKTVWFELDTNNLDTRNRDGGRC